MIRNSDCLGGSTFESTSTNTSENQKSSVQETASALVIAAADKAGMQGIDRERIDSIILRESGNSLFMQQQKKRDQQVNVRIEQLFQRVQEEDRKLPNWRTKMQKIVDQEIPNILAKRPIRSTCVVVDMDMFYFACHLLTQPELTDKPACVGGSMITTSNYVARKYGVRAAMAGHIGDALVKELSNGTEKLIHVKSDFALYKSKSAIVKQVLTEYDPNLKMYSLDEAFCDLAPYLVIKMTEMHLTHEEIRQRLIQRAADAEEKASIDRKAQSPKDMSDADSPWSESMDVLASFRPGSCLAAAADVVKEMRQRVFEATGGLTCSAGLAPNFMLAKIASDYNKPNGQCVVASDHESVTGFLYPQKCRKVPGIGRVCEKTLMAFGIQTVEALYRERALVRFLFKPATSSFLLRASLGCSSSNEKSSDDARAIHGQKGISRERTFQAGQSWSEVISRLEDIAQLLSSDMEKKKLWARTITMKVKLHTFDVYSRARSMPRGVFLQKGKDLFEQAVEVLRELRSEFKGKSFSVRLLGIRCNNFKGEEDSAQVDISKFFESKPKERSPTNHETARQNECSSILTPTKEARPSLIARKPQRAPRESLQTACRVEDEGTNDEIIEQASVTPDGTGTSHQSSSATTVSTPREAIIPSCPICAQLFPGASELELSQHVDRCLNSVSHMAEPQAPSVSCPVCNKQFSEQQNDLLNQHIDDCLSGREVRKLVREQTTMDTKATRATKKRRRISDYF